jgi:RNA-binding protein
MLTSKQRAYLRSLANSIDTILMVGKGGLSEQIYKTADDALTARELIKGKVLETCELSVREVADTIAAEINADVVQVIGTKFVLFRQKKKESQYKLPKANSKA